MPDTMDIALPDMPDTPAMESAEEADAPAMTGTPDSLMTAGEAAQALGVSERTVRRWVASGELSGTRVRGPHGPELRIDRGAVAAYRMIQPPAADKPAMPVMPVTEKPAIPDWTPDMTGRPDNGLPDMPDSLRPTRSARTGSDMPDTSLVVQVLQARLDGAQLAAKLNAKRREDARRQADEERQRLIAAEDRARAQEAAASAEIEFLRQQLQQRADAERELRILLAQATQALHAVNEKPALEANTAPPVPSRRWWMLWSR